MYYVSRYLKCFMVIEVPREKKVGSSSSENKLGMPLKSLLYHIKIFAVKFDAIYEAFGPAGMTRGVWYRLTTVLSDFS